LTYNTANAVGSGCVEGHDGGLTDFGRELVAEMNRVGMAIDLSHCGRETSRQTILASQRPVMYSHIAPSAFKTFERNKTDEELRFIAQNGGYIGVSLHPPFLRHGNDSTMADYVEVIEHTINVAGEDHVGLGTDYICGPPLDAATWVTLIRDKFHARKLTDVVMQEIRYPSELDQMRGFRSIPEAMAQRGWTEERIRKVVGGNCLRFLEQAWSRQ
jgi:membrane dipeptidase